MTNNLAKFQQAFKPSQAVVRLSDRKYSATVMCSASLLIWWYTRTQVFTCENVFMCVCMCMCECVYVSTCMRVYAVFTPCIRCIWWIHISLYMHACMHVCTRGCHRAGRCVFGWGELRMLLPLVVIARAARGLLNRVLECCLWKRDN